MQRKTPRRTKSERSLAYLLAFSFAACTPAVLADQRDVLNAQKYVKEVGENQEESITAHFDLACAYLEDEKYQKADDAFNKAVAIEKRVGLTTHGIVTLYMDWAERLVEHYEFKKNPELLKQATQAIAGATLATKRIPLHDSVYYHQQMIDFFRKVGMKAEEKKQIQIFDNSLSAVEQGPLESHEITQIGFALKQLAAMHARALSVHEIHHGTKPTEQVTSDNTPSKPKTIKQSEFSKAECYMLRANQVFSRLAENSHIRLQEQRELIFWFRYYGRKSQEEFQTRQLAKLVHSNDLKIMFPPVERCLGCGRG